MEIDCDDSILVYEHGKCTYDGDFAALSCKRQEELQDAVYLFKLDPATESHDWLVIFF